MNEHSPQSVLNFLRGHIIQVTIGGLCFALTACASIVSKSQYPVTVSSNPSGADFTIKKENGVAISTGITPATIVLSSSSGYFQAAKYTVEFKRKGVTQAIPFSATINGWYFGNLLFGGVIIGMLIVDPATGAMWHLNDTVVANFNQTAGINTKHILKICTLDQIPLSMRKDLVAIN